MDLILFNVSWMTFNLWLAIIPILSGWVMYKTQQQIIRILAFGIWLAFVPNTLYLLTDLPHLAEQWNYFSPLERGISCIMYAGLTLLGCITYVLAVDLFEKLLYKYTHSQRILWFCILGLNLAIGFGMTLGRIERTNSWELLTNFSQVIKDIHHLFTTPAEIALSLLFAAVGDSIYFLWKMKKPSSLR